MFLGLLFSLIVQEFGYKDRHYSNQVSHGIFLQVFVLDYPILCFYAIRGVHSTANPSFSK